MQIQNPSLRIPSKLLAKYNLKEGQQKFGGFSKVVFGTRKQDGLPIAVKLYDMHKCSMDDILKEVELLKKCNHPNIIKLLDYFSEGPSQAIVLERGSENLKDYCNDMVLDIREKQEIMRQIIRANYYLNNEMKTMHRDLKLENIVRVGDVWKLIDFGFATNKQIEEFTSKSQLGNMYGMAPEILNSDKYNNKTDIFSLGVLYYRIIFGTYPFMMKDVEAMKKQPYNGLGISDKCNKDSADFIKGCLRYDPKNRLDWVSIMRHKVMESNALDDILFRQYPVTRSAKFKNHDEEIMFIIFQDPDEDVIRNSSVLKKLLILRKRVVIYDALFVEPTEMFVKNLVGDSSADGYVHRQFLVPLINHALYHMVQLLNLIKNNNFEMQTQIFDDTGRVVQIVDSRFPNTSFTIEQIEMWKKHQFRQKSYDYFERIQDNLNSKLHKYSKSSDVKSKEVKLLKRPQYQQALCKVRQLLRIALSKTDDKVFQDDITKLLSLIQTLLLAQNNCFLDSLAKDEDLQAFVKKFIYQAEPVKST